MAKVLGVTLFLASLGLGGCATTAQQTASAAEYCGRVDCATMALIDQVATQRGVEVVWVHPPLRN
jgi:hypothetical protein